MENKKYLIEQIRKCRRKINIAKLIDSGILYAAAGGVFGIFCELFSLFKPFYHAHLAAGLCFGAGLFAGICHAIYSRADMKQAALRLDSFGLKERMLTACENLEAEDEFAVMQRQDARFHYDRLREKIKISLMPDKRHILAFLVSAAAVVGIALIPSSVRDHAKLRHQVQEQAEEEKKELEKLVDALEGVDMESLTEAQRAELQKLLETMELSREELAGADSWESLSAAAQRLDYKYGQAAQDLGQLAAQMDHPEAAGVAGAEAFAKAAANQSGQQTASVGAGATASPGGGSESGGENSSGGNGGQAGENNSGGNGGQAGENSSGGNGGQAGGEGFGEGDGQGSGNGSGGGGRGDGSDGSGGQGGDGEGGGSGGNGGTGNGAGSGRGTGHSDTAHDYVSVPGDTAEDPPLTGSKIGDQNSEYYRGQNGLAWEGDHVEYSSVIGEYTDDAYEGIANGKYPNGMESVIRDYFEQLNK